MGRYHQIDIFQELLVKEIERRKQKKLLFLSFERFSFNLYYCNVIVSKREKRVSNPLEEAYRTSNAFLNNAQQLR